MKQLNAYAGKPYLKPRVQEPKQEHIWAPNINVMQPIWDKMIACLGTLHGPSRLTIRDKVFIIVYYNILSYIMLYYSILHYNILQYVHPRLPMARQGHRVETLRGPSDTPTRLSCQLQAAMGRPREPCGMKFLLQQQLSACLLLMLQHYDDRVLLPLLLIFKDDDSDDEHNSLDLLFRTLLATVHPPWSCVFPAKART